MTVDLSALLEDDRPKHNYKANADLEQAVKLYQEGISVTKIIDKTSVSTATLYKELKAQGISKRSSSNKLNYNNKESEVIKRYKKGEPVESIKNSMHMSSETLYKCLRRNNVKLRGTSNSFSNLDNAVKLYQEGASIRTILKETNLSSNALYAELDNRGIKRRGGINNQNHQPVKPEPDHNVDNRYVSQLQSHEPDKVPGFWKRLKYAFSANTNDLKD